MLVFAALAPHPPFIIPALGQEHVKKLKKTITAMSHLTADFLAAKPDVVIIISPHGSLMTNAFTINTAPLMTADFKKFGALETKFNFIGDIGLSYQIKEFLETKLPVQLINDATLDYGAAIPLYHLLNLATDQTLAKKIKIIPIGYCQLDLKTHASLGHYLIEFIHRSPKRIALVASGDLSHCLSPDSPAGYAPIAQEFDDKISELINQKDALGLMQLDNQLISVAKECGLKPIVVLMHALSETNYQPQILSYEHPFGVGYLTVNFHTNN